MFRSFSFLIVLAFLTACTTSQPSSSAEGTDTQEINPPAEGFDLANSDPEAISIADEVMLAMGSRRAWDTTRFIKWDFFGFRTLTWDKESGLVRIDLPRDSSVYVVNIFSKEGKAWEKGEAVTQADSLAKRMEKAESIWINDAYWLVMPFKLKDSGVTLTYVGKDSTEAGAPADLLELRFEAVGRTPQNKYQVWVDDESRLVTQWAYFPKATDTEPRFVNPWLEYQSYGDLLLSGSRGERKLENISVSQSMPASLFEEL